MPKISIIVPVYKVEKYLNRCINSILSQTFTDFELILVDDGSPDNCPIICDQYAQEDSRIKVLHQKNAGVSAARNTGLDVAKGEYIGFVDSDDWIEPSMYQVLYDDIVSTNADITICGFCKNFKYKITDKIVNRTNAQKILFSQKGFGGFSFLRLIRKSIIGNIRFDTNLSYMEDVKFFFELHNHCNKVYWHSIPLYHYEDNTNSVTHKYGLSSQIKTALVFLSSLYKNIENKKLKNYIKNFYTDLVFGIHISYIRNNDTDNKDYKYLSEIIKSNLFIYLLSTNITLKRKIFVLLNYIYPLYRIYNFAKTRREI